MQGNSTQDDSRMPITDPDLWQSIAKWMAGLSASLLGLYAAAVKWWVGDRFKKIDERFDSVENDVKKQEIKLSEHDTALVRLETHMEHSQKNQELASSDRIQMHKKLDNITALVLKNGSTGT